MIASRDTFSHKIWKKVKHMLLLKKILQVDRLLKFLPGNSPTVKTQHQLVVKT